MNDSDSVHDTSSSPMAGSEQEDSPEALSSSEASQVADAVAEPMVEPVVKSPKKRGRKRKKACPKIVKKTK